jgi:dipeptidyl-peptidase-4
MRKTKIQVIIVSCLFQLCLWLSLSAQIVRDTTIIRQLPRITGWADNTHYIVEKWTTKLKKYDSTKVNIDSGTESNYTVHKSSVPPKVDIIDGDIYLLSAGTKVKLTDTEVVEKLPSLSPDHKWVAFIRDNDLYAVEIATGAEIRYTNDGSETIMNGYASWVYYEEILRRNSKYCAFWWAPDSKHLAFYRFDDSDVPVVPLYDIGGQHGSVELTRYPKAGDPNPKVQAGIVPVDGGSVVWADFNPNEDQYFGTPFWRPDGSGLLVQWMPREQNNLKLYDIDPDSGKKKEIYHEQQATWINWVDRLRWIDSGFLMVRDYDGWEQIYYHASDGKLKYQLTTGRNWNTQIVRVDEKTQTVYYRSNAELSTRTDLYSAQLDGKHQKRLTFGNFTHTKLLLSPDAHYLLTNYSTSEIPERIAMINLRNGDIKEIADSKGTRFDSIQIPKREIVWLKTKDGFELPGRIVWPKVLQEGEKYPVIINIYGGPNHQSVSDGWVDFLSSKEDMAVIRVGFDHRGSGHCGKLGLNYLHRNLGKWEMEDYIAWVTWLRQQPYVDPDKIMITGGSYGGYLTALALTYGSAYFNYGIADYPVTDWQLYDSHYTERYMDLPKDNPEGYHFGSVMTHAANYRKNGRSMLLIQHGTMDDNVHIQNTYQLADALQSLNKPFELMIYPGERHGWRGAKTPFTVDTRREFQEKHLFGQRKTDDEEKIVDFVGVTLDEHNFDSRDLRGKYALISFWGSWCMPCRKSHPHLKELYNRYYPKGLEIIGIAREFYQDERGQVSWKRAVEQDSLPWPQLLNSNMPQDVVKIYDVKTFPTKILVAPDGTILWRGGSKDITDLDNILQNIFDKHSQ